jgi:ubiquinone/menaquinone biosynthesis C-methylase UbiE
MEQRIPISFFQAKYDRTNPLTRLILRRFFSDVTGLIPPAVQSGLEVGCGPGFSSPILRHSFPGPTFEASDIDAEHVSAARMKNPDIPVGLESIYALQRPDSSFDIVFALEVLEHLERPRAALDELHRVSSRYVILSVPREPLWRGANMLRGKYLRHLGNTPGHINHWSAADFARLVGERFAVRTMRTPFPWTIILAEKT